MFPESFLYFYFLDLVVLEDFKMSDQFMGDILLTLSIKRQNTEGVLLVSFAILEVVPVLHVFNGGGTPVVGNL